MEERDFVAIVPAGGKGARMKSDLPKVLHDLSGRSVITEELVREPGASVADQTA